MHQIDDSGPVLPDRLEAGLQAAFGRAEGEASVLEVVSRIAGCDAKVLLREIEQGETPAPLVEASGREGDAPSPGRGSYHVLGRLGGGGMGEVLKAHDLDLGRDVALKVLRDEHRSDPALLRRFVEEAQVGGQLQHPGIVPVYELGLMADQRPYFAMRLVKGRTLSALLKTRRDPGEDRRRFLGIFEDVCLTVAYAHSRGVIHRDLKPSNVMVGAFGEVQVVDWGLAKILRKGERGDSHGQTDEEVSRIETVRSRSGSTETDSVDGAVIGTPVCMPPEQARGEVERLDERADVFSLGAILAQILTGRPLYRGSGEEILAQALRAELGPIREALAACDAEPELVELCEECLSAAPAERPADAGVVARRLHDHLEAIEARSRTAQIEAAEARVRVAAERRARKLTVSLAASVVVTVLALGGGWAWLEVKGAERERERTAQVDAALTEANLALGREQWTEAASAARRVLALAGEDAASEALALKTEAAEAIVLEADEAAGREELAEENRGLLAALRELRQPEGDEIYPTDWAELDAAFEALFADHGLVVEGTPPEEAVESIRARGIPDELAAALDEWALVRRRAEDPEGAGRLWDLAEILDDDEDRVALRVAVRSADEETLKGHAEELTDMPVGTLLLLARSLGSMGAHDEAVAVYRHGLLYWPDEFALRVGLARQFAETEPEQAVRQYTAALALRPESVEVRHELGIVLHGRLDEGDHAGHEQVLELFKRSTDLLGDDAHLQLHLGWLHRDMGRWDEALRSFRRALEIDPACGMAHVGIGLVYKLQGRREDAIDSFREAASCSPSLAEPHVELGDVLSQAEYERPGSGDLDAAIASYRLALERDPKHPFALHNLGIALMTKGSYEKAIECFQTNIDLGAASPRLFSPPELLVRNPPVAGVLQCYRGTREIEPDQTFASSSHGSLSAALRLAGRLDKALVAAQEAKELAPESAMAHARLGEVFRALEENEKAVDSLERAVELDDGFSSAYSSLGHAYWELEREEDAIRAFEQHVDLHPDCTQTYYNLGVLYFGRDWKRSEEFFQEEVAIRKRTGHPGLGEAYGWLAQTLQVQGRNQDAIECFELALDNASRDGERYWTFAYFLCNAGDPFYRDLDRAVRLAKRATELIPERTDAWGTLGIALYRSGDYPAALESLEMACGLRRERGRPARPEYGYYLAMAHFLCGDQQGAEDSYWRAVEDERSRKSDPANSDTTGSLTGFRAEAAKLIGLERHRQAEEPTDG